MSYVDNEGFHAQAREAKLEPAENIKKFASGAVRSGDAEATRYDLISPIAMEALAETYAEGAIKYDSFNWEKGMAAHDLLNHALRHIFKFLSGDRSEPHLPHAMWNVGAAIHSVKLWPKLNESTLRGEGCTPPKAVVQPVARKAETEEEFLDAVESVASTPKGTPATHVIDPDTKHLTFHEKYPAIFGDYNKYEASCLDQLKGTSPLRAAFGDWLIGGHVVKSMNGETPPKHVSTTESRNFYARFLAAVLSGRQKSEITLYLSGPMSGIPGHNFPAFDRAAQSLRDAGWRVVSPADFGAKPDKSWNDHLKRDLFILGECDVLVQLPGWENSRGASLEFTVAGQTGKFVASLADVLSLS